MVTAVWRTFRLDTVRYMALWGFLAALVYHFVTWRLGAEVAYNADLAIAAVLGWVFALQFCRTYRAVGIFVVVLQEIFLADLLKWILIYILFLAGFGLALFVVVREQFINNSAAIILGERGPAPTFFPAFSLPPAAFFSFRPGPLAVPAPQRQ